MSYSSIHCFIESIDPTEPANITVPPSAPSDDHVVQGGEVYFTCTASGANDLSIKWKVDEVVYDSSSCSGDNSICIILEPERTDSNGEKTSTLTIITNNMDPVKNETDITVVCMVNQTLNVGPSIGHEIRLPTNNSRSQSSDPVQFRISPAPPITTPPTGAPLTSGNTSPAGEKCKSFDVHVCDI